MTTEQTEVGRLFAEWEAIEKARGRGYRKRRAAVEKALLAARPRTLEEVALQLVPFYDRDVTNGEDWDEISRQGVTAACHAAYLWKRGGGRA